MRPQMHLQVRLQARHDERRVGADTAEGRRGEGGLEGEADEVKPGNGAAHPGALVRSAVLPQGAQGLEVIQIRAVAGGEDDGIHRLLPAVVPENAVPREAGEDWPPVGFPGEHRGGVGPVVHDAAGLRDVEETS